LLREWSAAFCGGLVEGSKSAPRSIQKHPRTRRRRTTVSATERGIPEEDAAKTTADSTTPTCPGTGAPTADAPAEATPSDAFRWSESYPKRWRRTANSATIQSFPA
jgi:hypothetical protein